MDKLFTAWFVFVLLIALALLSLFAWAIIRVVTHFT